MIRKKTRGEKHKLEVLLKIETDGWIKIPQRILDEVQLHDGSQVAIKIHFRGTMGSYLVLYPAEEEDP